MISTLHPRRRHLRTSTMLAAVSATATRPSAPPDLGPHNPWRRLAQNLWKTDWCIRLVPFNRSLVARHCKTIGADFERKRLGEPHTIKAKDIEAWIAARTDSETVAAGYRVVFRRLLGGNRPARVHFINAVCRTWPPASRLPKRAARSAKP